MHERLRIGVIGANPETSWAARAHLPAIVAAENLELTAVATSRMASAQSAAEHYGASYAFASAEDLAECPDVDAVVIAVRVPNHRELLESVLSSGKHVYCEWPLGVNPEEAEMLAELAQGAGVRTAVGLQARSLPELRFLKDLIAEGAIGTVTSCFAHAFSRRGAVPVEEAKRYLFDSASGANMLTIETGHLLDALAFLLGEPRGLRGEARVRRSLIPAVGGEWIANDTPEVVVALGETAEKALVTINVAQGTCATETTEITVIGTEGAARLVTRGPGGIQMAPVELLVAPNAGSQFSPVTTPSTYRAVTSPLTPSAVNVAEALTAFARDISSGTRTVPDFWAAVARHRTLERITEDFIVSP